ncbi:hypothetical protein YC2023_075501 [Brassica napus]
MERTKYFPRSKPLCRVSDPANHHTLCRRSDPPLSICFACKDHHLKRNRYYYYCSTCDLEFHRGCHLLPPKGRTQLSPMIVSNMIQSRGEALINHYLPIAGNSNPLERETHISPMIVSNMVQTQDEVLITNDLSIAGSRNFCQRGTQKSPLIMSNMMHTQDEIPVLMIRLLLEVVMYLREEHKYTRRLNGAAFRELTKSLRGLGSIGLVVYESGKSKLTSFSSRRGRESM